MAANPLRHKKKTAAATPARGDTVRNRLKSAGRTYLANDNISEFLKPGDLAAIEQEVERCAGAILDALVIDTENDHNTRGTAKRLAKMFVHEVFAGRYLPPPKCTDFPNVTSMDEIYVVGPITVRSACSHHLCPIEGEVWFGVIPGERVIGLSKFSRIANWILSRPQIQEEAVMQLADEVERIISPRGLAVVLSARHSCMTWRGVKEDATAMTTSVMRGIFRDGPAARAEVLSLIQAKGFRCQ
ncbi:GTP cyclohydrolase I [Bradyrhizobium sp. BRP23]|nr:GTP cyclohydrolase I [Bradyrhizobium sp. BRP23]